MLTYLVAPDVQVLVCDGWQQLIYAETFTSPFIGQNVGVLREGHVVIYKGKLLARVQTHAFMNHTFLLHATF